MADYNMGDRARCSKCFRQIEYEGRYWSHVFEGLRHAPVPHVENEFDDPLPGRVALMILADDGLLHEVKTTDSGDVSHDDLNAACQKYYPDSVGIPVTSLKIYRVIEE